MRPWHQLFSLLQYCIQKRMKQILGSSMNLWRKNHGMKCNFLFSWENRRMPSLQFQLTFVKDFFYSVSRLGDSSLFLHISVAHSFLLLSTIALHGYITVYFLILLLIDTWTVSSFLLQRILLWVFSSKTFLKIVFQFSQLNT